MVDAERDHFSTEADALWSLNAAESRFFPFQLDRTAILRKLPMQSDVAARNRQGAIFDRIRVELVERHRQAEQLPLREQKFRAAIVGAALRGVRAEHLIGQRPDRYLPPIALDEQIVAPGEGLKAAEK